MSLNETRVLVLHPDIKQLQNDKKEVNSSLTEAVLLAKSLNLKVIKQQSINISVPSIIPFFFDLKKLLI